MKIIKYLLIFCLLLTNSFTVLEKDLKIISRKEWGAKDPIKEMILHNPTKITIHHSGIKNNYKSNLIEKMKALQKYSQSAEKMDTGKIKEIWGDVPYHYIISTTGEIAEGREIKYSGDTNTEYNPKNHILIDVLGNFDLEEPTKQQIKSLEELCFYLHKKYNIPLADIKTHNFYAKTNCPGENLIKFMPKLLEELEINDKK
ncbi:MAG: peptidoglycan recognition family protein [Candidatus Sericytochromatia bacterium]